MAQNVWSGWYEQCGQKFNVQFSNFNANPVPGGLIKGDGTDTVGQFVLSGSFSPDVKLCRFTKQYKSGTKHSVYYQGEVIKNPPTIKGFWGLNPGDQDGNFQIKMK